MSEDLISNNFINNVNIAVIKRNIKLLQAGLFLSFIYAVVLCIDWYLGISMYKQNFASALYFYLYFIYPVVLLSLLLLTIYGIVFNIKANRSMIFCLENADADRFNNAYLFFTKASLLSIIAFSVSIVFTILRFFIK